jgi:hypothetical protein
VQSFPLTIERKERKIYFSALLNGEAGNFFGPLIANAPVTQTLNVFALEQNSSADARLAIALQGVTRQPHQVTIEINGRFLGYINFANREHTVAQFTLALALLRRGPNEIKLSAPTSSDVSLLDYVRLTYPRRFQAENDTLNFTLAAGQTARVNGFSTPAIRVLDITDPDAVRELQIKTRAEAAEANGYGFTVQADAERVLLALSERRLARVAAVTRNQPSRWQEYSGADFVIITHRDFLASAERLAGARRRAGLSVAVVDVEDIYDEFSFGAHTAQALKDFLRWAREHWPRAPRFALLVGDGSTDPRNYFGYGDFDFLPAKLLDAGSMETAADGWLADFNDDGLPELAVGRLPVRTAAEAETVIAKLINFAPESSARGALLVTDRYDGYDFAAASQRLQAELPGAMNVQTINRADGAAEEVRGRIIQAINQGPLVVNFSGHGSVEVWTGSGLLRTQDAAALTNQTRLSLFVMTTCLNGYYIDPLQASLAEAVLLRASGGAVAVLASTSLTGPDPQDALNRQFYRSLFSGQTIGEALNAAKAAVADPDVRHSYVLFGDPTLRLVGLGPR